MILSQRSSTMRWSHRERDQGSIRPRLRRARVVTDRDDRRAHVKR
jgi:hypothetical protein